MTGISTAEFFKKGVEEKMNNLTLQDGLADKSKLKFCKDCCISLTQAETKSSNNETTNEMCIEKKS